MTFSAETVNWQWHAWRELTPDVLYACLKLRSDIFVVEQNCVFSDMDGVDPACEHLTGFASDGRLLAYLRLLPPGVKMAEASLGRLVVAADQRRSGLARQAMQRGLDRLHARFPDSPIRIGGQTYMEAFYTSMGFVTVEEPYLEDGIPHVHMIYRGLYSRPDFHPA